MYGMMIDSFFLTAMRVMQACGLQDDIIDLILEYALWDILHGVQLQEAAFSCPRGAAVARWVFKLPVDTKCIRNAQSTPREQLWEITNTLVAHVIKGESTYPIPYSVSWSTSAAPVEQRSTSLVRTWFLDANRSWGNHWPFWTLGMQRVRFPHGEYPPNHTTGAGTFVPACSPEYLWPSGYPIWQTRLAHDEPVVERGQCGAKRTDSGAPCRTPVSPYSYDYCKAHGGWEYAGLRPRADENVCTACIMMPFWPLVLQRKCGICAG